MNDIDLALTAERLRELFNYNPETGVFTRRIKASKRTMPGDIAGSVSNRRYLTIFIKNKRYVAHRLAWLYMTGSWPINCIDHINGEKSDNKFSNLRDVSLSVNQENRQGPQKNNTTGFLGVQFRREKWTASIRKNGKCTHLGSFQTPELAHAAYLAAKSILHAESFHKDPQ